MSSKNPCVQALEKRLGRASTLGIAIASGFCRGNVMRLTRRGSVGLLAISCVVLTCAVEQARAQSANDLPERYRRQVAPGPAAPWHPPDLRGYSSALKPTEQAPIDPARQYDLPELIDVAQRVNPETRVAWERAR